MVFLGRLIIKDCFCYTLLCCALIATTSLWQYTGLRVHLFCCVFFSDNTMHHRGTACGVLGHGGMPHSHSYSWEWAAAGLWIFFNFFAEARFGRGYFPDSPFLADSAQFKVSSVSRVPTQLPSPASSSASSSARSLQPHGSPSDTALLDLP